MCATEALYDAKVIRRTAPRNTSGLHWNTFKNARRAAVVDTWKVEFPKYVSILGTKGCKTERFIENAHKYPYNIFLVITSQTSRLKKHYAAAYEHL